jgi:hypothetical protein
MSATGVQLNWENVSIGSTGITRVTSCNFAYNGSLLGWAGDLDVIDSVKALVKMNPTATVTSGDIGTLLSFTPGTVAVLTATLKDAKGATGGNVIFTLSNAIVANVDGSGQHAAWGTATLHVESFATDGATNPLAITRV